MKNLLLLIFITMSFVACNSGGGGGTITQSHSSLANNFVNDLNYSSGFNVTLTKTNTLQYDYIVIYDPLYNSYDAVYIGNYDPIYDNAATYYSNNVGSMYVDLYRVDGHYDYYNNWIPTRYHDYYTGVVFEKTATTSKDLAKVIGLAEVAKQGKTAEYLSEKLGLSLSRGKEIAKLASHWEKASKKGMTDADQNKFSKELLGFSIDSATSAYKKSLQGDSTDLNSLLEKSATTNGITPEHAAKLMTKLFKL